MVPGERNRLQLLIMDDKTRYVFKKRYDCVLGKIDEGRDIATGKYLFK